MMNLVIHERIPEVAINGTPLRLQQMQWLLLSALAERAPDIVPSETLYAELWGDKIVEDGQLAFQACRLRKALAKVSPDLRELVICHPGRGYSLKVDPSAVIWTLPHSPAPAGVVPQAAPATLAHPSPALGDDTTPEAGPAPKPTAGPATAAGEDEIEERRRLT